MWLAADSTASHMSSCYLPATQVDSARHSGA